MTRYQSVILASCLLYGHAVLADATAPGNTATGQQWQPAVSLNNTATPVSVPPAPVDVPARPVEGDVPPPQSGNSQASQTSQAESATDIARAVTLPLPPEDITQLRKEYDDLQRHSAFNPLTVVPRIRSLTVKLTPGASLPMMQVLPNYPGVINFTDQNGAPWPVAAPPINGNEKGFRVVYLPDAPSIVVQASRVYDTGSVTVYLKGLAVPVTISLASGSPSDKAASQFSDSRLDLRIPQTQPGKSRPVRQAKEKVGLYDDTLQAFLDGVPPNEARALRVKGDVPATQAWQMGDDLYLRSGAILRDEFEQTLTAADGTHVWKLPVTPYVMFSVQGNNVPLTIDLE